LPVLNETPLRFGRPLLWSHGLFWHKVTRKWLFRVFETRKCAFTWQSWRESRQSRCSRPPPPLEGPREHAFPPVPSFRGLKFPLQGDECDPRCCPP
jgi:hypothetical protein